MSAQFEFDWAGHRKRGRTIQERFERFHAARPEVYRQLVDLARWGKLRGHTSQGIGQLFEVLRWNWSTATLPAPGEQFKLSNDYRSRYARLIMEQEPDLEGIFRTRDLRSW